MTITRYALVLGFVATLTSTACSNQKPEPLTASSAGQSGYAERYPDQLGNARGGFVEQESAAQRVMAEFSTYPDELDEPGWDHVGTVVERADEAGRSSAYVDQLRQNDAVVQFFSEEEQELNNAVGGAVVYAAKQKGVDADGLGGAATGALKRSVQKQLEERARERNEAHRYIEENQDALGKKNVDKLKSQADKISYVSYVVHVAVPQAQQDMQRLVDEGSEVKSTLDRTIEEANAVAADEKRGKADREAAKKRVEAAEAAKARIDEEIQQAQHALTEIEQRQQKLKQDYDAALEALKNKVEEKARAAAESKPAS